MTGESRFAGQESIEIPVGLFVDVESAWDFVASSKAAWPNVP